MAAGVFQDAAETDESDWEPFAGRPDIDAPEGLRFGLRVEGESMNQIYPPGTILECVKYYGNEPLANGRRVIVERFKVGDGVEATVKEYMKDGEGIEWLMPRSNNPRFQSPFRCDQPEDGIDRIEVTAIVVAATIKE